MPTAAFCGPPHSESEVYYVKSSAIDVSPPRICDLMDRELKKVSLTTTTTTTQRADIPARWRITPDNSALELD